MRVLMAGLLFWIATACAASAARYALVIGNDAYAHVTPLRKAVADARAYRHNFEAGRGFDHVFYAENADVAAMDAEIGAFLAAVRPGDTAVVVFSGHGVQLNPDRGDTLFLLPTDVPAFDAQNAGVEYQLGRRAIRFSELRQQLAASGAAIRVFVLDACRDNPFAVGDGSKSVGLVRGLAAVQRQTGEFIFYAAGPGEKALDRLSDGDTDPNSVFSRVFLKRFRRGAFLEDVANQVQAEVYELAKRATPSFIQEPWYSDGVRGKACLDAHCDIVTPPPPASGGDQEAKAKQAYDTASESGDPRRLDLVATQFPNTYWGKLAALDAADLRANEARRNSDDAAPRPPVQIAPADPATPGASGVREAQRELRRLGLYDGAIDGLWGRGSSSGLQEFQRRQGLSPADGRLTEQVLEALRAAASPPLRPKSPQGGFAGVYEGTYTCNRGGQLSQLVLSIEERGLGVLTGVFTFKTLRGIPGAGSYALEGRVDASGAFTMRGTAWIVRPRGYVKVNLDGRFSPDRRNVEGGLSRPCDSFKATRTSG